MSYISEVRLTGYGKREAVINFQPGPNVLTGDSDTGKTYILQCIDYALGAEKIGKKPDEAKGYEFVWLELRNIRGETLTLQRHLPATRITVYKQTIKELLDGLSTESLSSEQLKEELKKFDSEVVLRKRSSTSKSRDITSAVFPFWNLTDDLRVRKNQKGDTSRLSLRVLLSAILVGETSIITEDSPIVGSGFGQTDRKSLLSFMLTGEDDSSLLEDEVGGVSPSELNAKIALLDELIDCINVDDAITSIVDIEEELQQVEKEIEEFSFSAAEIFDERDVLYKDREQFREQITYAESQHLAVSEMLSRYQLLSRRYDSDLKRLDFVSEGAHYFNSLQKVVCPYCGNDTANICCDSNQEQDTASLYAAASSEAAKIRGLKIELGLAVNDLELLIKSHENKIDESNAQVTVIDEQLNTTLLPTSEAAKRNLDQLIEKQTRLQAIQANYLERQKLLGLKSQYCEALPDVSPEKKLEPLEANSLLRFCTTLEQVLYEYSWPKGVRVAFNEDEFDIAIDGKPRQEHGKGYRAVVNAAYFIGLMKYCCSEGLPHAGFVILDTPLNSVKQGGENKRVDEQSDEDKLDPKVEVAFWDSLSKLTSDVQVIVIENKEPDQSLNKRLNVQFFPGRYAKPGQRKAFIPVEG